VSKNHEVKGYSLYFQGFKPQKEVFLYPYQKERLKSFTYLSPISIRVKSLFLSIMGYKTLKNPKSFLKAA
jgi:hypothetical protein